MSDQENSENQHVKVNDRRRFTADGETLETNRTETHGPAASETSSEASTAKAEPDSNETAAFPPEFSSLIFSLAASCQMALGIAANPMTGKLEKNLVQAKQTIDLLAVLEEKTRGNLTKEEDQLLKALLYDLRMRFVEAKQTL